MDFTRIRGKRANKRCINIGRYGSPLYCNCGCQTPQEGDQPYIGNTKNYTAKWIKGYQWYIALFYNSKQVGQIDPTRNYIFLNQNEYLGVKKDSTLAKLLLIPIQNKNETIISAGSTLAETATQSTMTEKFEIAELDERNKNHPGYCTKCHSFCYGDCETTC